MDDDDRTASELVGTGWGLLLTDLYRDLPERQGRQALGTDRIQFSGQVQQRWVPPDPWQRRQQQREVYGMGDVLINLAAQECRDEPGNPPAGSRHEPTEPASRARLQLWCRAGGDAGILQHDAFDSHLRLPPAAPPRDAHARFPQRSRWVGFQLGWGKIEQTAIPDRGQWGTTVR
ncbi:hypothetical protein GGTG_03016 [Gaeumannomyces tritici R3-111a-1]|uniref:Uncharacterized protein n=1 Tax=Gaeumannomyces tritici (strain R3-111a-1) TaxID=644352 RepID=J3NP10_GAET3|nr:hypothetical protein GGTG_03016 [Gaeumannomyces tritici R3-111a-1]EJT77913.1 hypothetical protein GGTG_03016 [Gaeumannomyces tritici R3-111a-1]